MNKLPMEFSSLEKWSAWALETETERNKMRISREFEDIKLFADEVLPFVKEVTEWLDRRKEEKNELSKEEKSLFNLLMSLAEVAPAIESYDPKVIVIDGYDSDRFPATEDHVLRPKKW